MKSDSKVQMYSLTVLYNSNLTARYKPSEWSALIHKKNKNDNVIKTFTKNDKDKNNNLIVVECKRTMKIIVLKRNTYAFSSRRQPSMI